MSNSVIAELGHGGDRSTALVNMSSCDTTDVRVIDRRSEFGNPFKLSDDGGEYSRRESVEEYMEWFETKLSEDYDFMRRVLDLRGDTLGCWCVPQLCHGHVILYYLDNFVVPESIRDIQEWRSESVDCHAMHGTSR